MSNVLPNPRVSSDNADNANRGGAALQENDRFGPDPVLDRLIGLATRLVDMPIAIVALIEENVIRLAVPGAFAEAELAPDDPLWQAITADTTLLLPDAAADPRISHSHMLPRQGLRAVAALKLTSPEGVTLGALALASTVPRKAFTEAESTILADLAETVAAALHQRRQRRDTSRAIADLASRQAVTTLIAGAPTLTAALENLLAHVGERFDALYCTVCECDLAADTYRIIAGFASNPDLEILLLNERRASWRTLGELSCAAALRAGIPADSGPLHRAEQVAAYPGFACAVTLGTRRQLTLPITIDKRRFALAIGFHHPHPGPHIRATCADVAQWITPLLQGRLREEALAHAHALVARSNRALHTLLAANEAMATAPDEVSLAQMICDRAVEIGRYVAAWVGIAEPDDAATLRPIACAGTGIERIGQVHISWGDNVLGRGPSGTAVRENRPVVIDDVLADRRTRPWQEDTTFSSYTSAIALPLRDESGASFGSLTLLAADRADLPGSTAPSFDAEESRVLTQLARDLAFGISALRARTARDAALAERQNTARRFAQLLDSSPTVIYALEQRSGTMLPGGWALVEISANLHRLYGHHPEDAMAQGWWLRQIHDDDLETTLVAEHRLHAEGRLVHHYRFARSDGVYRWLRDEKILIRGQPGGVDRVVGSLADVTDQHRANAEIHRLAYHDQLTGLPNRAMLHHRLHTALAPPAERADQVGALLFLDLRGFEAINDLHGYAIGDQLLQEIARRLTAAMRREDMVACLGGGKYGILVTDLAVTPENAATLAGRIAEKLLDGLAAPLLVAGHECHVTADIGITLVSAAAPDVEHLFREAAIAVHQAQRAERSPIMFFEPAMQERVNRRHAVELALRHAIDHEHLELWLQSQVDREGAITGAEALIRLRQPDGTIMPPDAFIPVAEATGMIFALGRWVFAAAGRIAAGQRAAGRPLRLAINVSAVQFQDPAFATDLEDALARTGADPRDLVLEITESVLIDRGEAAVAKLTRLAGLGLRFSVDDFGIGYSSLGYLQSLPISELKIDRSFVQRLPDNARDFALAEAILALTRHLGLSAVAEGVETEAQAEFLRARHCQTMQGYLFGRPEPAPAWLARWQARHESANPAPGV